MKKKFASLAAVVLISSSLATNTYAATYTVKKGDSLSLIAKKYNISVKELKTLNKLKTDNIVVKQKIKVPNPKKSTKASATTKTYKVKSGDTLGKIASKYKVTIAQLKSWNKLKSDMIKPGQKLVVTKPAVSNQAAKEASKSVAPTAKTYDYTVASGDTLSGIALKAKMTVADIKEINQLTSDIIFVGQVLKLNSPVDGGQQPETKPPVTENVDYSIDKLISLAYSLKGVSYLWAGNTPSGFDCSGYIYYVYNEAGKNMIRTSTEGYFDLSYHVDKPQVGDLVFFTNTYKDGLSHMGIYVGNDEFIHASSSDGVTVSSLHSSYYQKHFDSFKRFY